MKLKHILDAAPPTPACFADRTIWSEFLYSAQRDGGAKPFIGGVYRPKFNFCADCPSDFAAGMSAAGKCKPDAFRALVLVKEAAA